jgi:sulfur-oxidizing protein SoxX
MLLMGAALAPAMHAAEALAAYRVDGLEIRAPLAGLRGDAARGRDIARNRNEGACLLCHALPASDLRPGEPFAGDLAPTLAGVGARLTAGQLRLRLVDSTRINAQSIMPAYHRVEGLNQVAAAWRGKPILNAQQIEDLVAYMQALK